MSRPWECPASAGPSTRRAFERVRHLQQTPVVSMTADDLKTDW